jgi:hypothetical protein
VVAREPPDRAAALALAQVAVRRLRSQRLIGPPLARPEDVVSWMGAVQAQDFAGAKWAVAQRTAPARATDAAVEEAFQRGAILRTHVMRPTWHFVAPADIRWLLELTAPRVLAASAYQLRKEGLDEPTCARANAAIAKAVQGGRHLTRDELADALRAAGLDTGGLRLTYLVMRAELDAVLCSGPRRGKQFTYAALDERAPAARRLPRDEALAELARRYFASHGPALPQDFAWWSGMKVSDALGAIARAGGDLAGEAIAGKTYVSARGAARPRRAAADGVHLLPAYDEYTVAYKDLAGAAPDGLGGAAPDGLGSRAGVLFNAVVLRGARVAGSWRRTLGPRDVLIEMTVEGAQGEGAQGAQAALTAEAQRYARFAGLPARVSLRAPASRTRRRAS